jgi:hypothetical protein
VVGSTSVGKNRLAYTCWRNAVGWFTDSCQLLFASRFLPTAFCEPFFASRFFASRFLPAAFCQPLPS